MTTIRQRVPVRQEVRLGEETRILIPDMTWDQYATFAGWLPDGSSIRVAFDGRNMELIVTSPTHDDFAELLDTFFKAVAGGLGIRYKPQRTTTWIRPEVQRGLEADCCYYLEPAKIDTALAALKARLNDVAHYPIRPLNGLDVRFGSPGERQSVAAQYESAETTSLPFRVARAWNTRPDGE